MVAGGGFTVPGVGSTLAEIIDKRLRERYTDEVVDQAMEYFVARSPMPWVDGLRDQEVPGTVENDLRILWINPFRELLDDPIQGKRKDND